MRKYLYLFFIFNAYFMSAQVKQFQPETYIGFNGGATESMVMFSPSVAQGFLQGYNGGLVFRYISEKSVGVQAELNFSQRGWTESTGLFSKQLNYIELPFMTHIYFGNRNRFFFNIGPKISYLISENNIVDNTSGSTDYQHITSTQNPLDYGLCTGFGLLFSIGKNQIQLDTRGNFSLSNIYSDKKTDYFSTSNNLNLSVNLAWLIKVK